MLLLAATGGCGLVSSPGPSPTTRQAQEEPRLATNHGSSSEAPSSAAGWFVVGSGELARIEVEQVLYERRGDPLFYVRLRIENLSDREVGADLRDADLVPYPNQWGGLAQPQRIIIDERRLNLDARRSAIATEAVEGLRAAALVQIPDDQWLEFYRPFNAGGVAEVKTLDPAETPYMFVSFDGLVPIAVSTVAELVATDASLILPVPVVWAQVPEDGWIIPH